MSDRIAHRGPDASGTWSHEADGISIQLGFRRLSIIDLTAAADQPLHKNGLTIVYNGEVYNYLELREELGADSFRTTSDTEVILRAYERWGPDCVNHLRGMFAFALWDAREHRLFLARDRFAIDVEGGEEGSLLDKQVDGTYLINGAVAEALGDTLVLALRERNVTVHLQGHANPIDVGEQAKVHAHLVG